MNPIEKHDRITQSNPAFAPCALCEIPNLIPNSQEISVMSEEMQINIEIHKAKVQGLHEFGLAKVDANKLLNRFDGDMLMAAGYERAVGCAVNVRNDREAWNLNYAKSMAYVWKVTDDYKIVQK
jgi:hypothetical protein